MAQRWIKVADILIPPSADFILSNRVRWKKEADWGYSLVSVEWSFGLIGCWFVSFPDHLISWHLFVKWCQNVNQTLPRPVSWYFANKYLVCENIQCIVVCSGWTDVVVVDNRNSPEVNQYFPQLSLRLVDPLSREFVWGVGVYLVGDCPLVR